MMRPDRTFHLLNVLVAIALCMLLSLAGCGDSASQNPAKTPPIDQPIESPVRYVKVVQQAVPETLDLAAKVQADPTKVVRSAIQGAASVAGLLITTEAMVADVAQMKSHAMPGGGMGGMDY